MSVANILVVDDEPLIGFAFKRELAADGYDVDSVLNGEEALKAVRVKKYDLALIDKDMPGMDGIETCKAIKKIAPDPVLVFMTGLFDKNNLSREGEFVAAGGKTYCLYKPFAQGELRAVVRKALDEKP